MAPVNGWGKLLTSTARTRSDLSLLLLTILSSQNSFVNDSLFRSFSDKDVTWDLQFSRSQAGLQGNVDDGEFAMAWADFMTQFSRVDFCQAADTGVQQQKATVNTRLEDCVTDQERVEHHHLTPSDTI